jgi:hypothetical protein
MWLGLIIILVYGAVIVWWAWEYGRCGWQGVTCRQMRYMSLGKGKVGEIDQAQVAVGDEALWKGALFLLALVVMAISWLFMAAGFVWSLLLGSG